MLVLVHEFGHFFTAKKFGIRVDEFGFGFPPKLFGVKKGETEYTFNLLPLGGFVKIFGDNLNDVANPVKVEPSQDYEGSTFTGDSSRSFSNKPKWQQAIVLFAGIFANFLLAWILFSFGFMSGFPTSVGNEPAGYKLQDVNLVVVSVLPKSPAENAGLRTGDKIVALPPKIFRGEYNNPYSDTVNDFSENYVNPETLKSLVTESGGREFVIGYTHGKNSEINFTKIKPKETNGEFTIGISMDEIGTAKLSFFPALWEGMKLNWYMAKSTTVGFYTLIKEGVQGRGSLASVTGPVGIVGIVGDAYQFGFIYLVSFTALISVNLAIINLIPFPALDGGRLFFLLIEKIKGSPMNPKVANTANTIGFVALILLMVVITYHDIAKLL